MGVVIAGEEGWQEMTESRKRKEMEVLTNFMSGILSWGIESFFLAILYLYRKIILRKILLQQLLRQLARLAIFICITHKR